MSHTDRPLDNAGVAHEHTDINVRALVGFGIGLFVVVAIVFGLMYGLFVVFEGQAAKNDPQLSPLARPPVDMPASQGASPYFGSSDGVQLLVSEPAVLRKQREMEAEALGTYGWVDEKTGVARIPIDEAKKLILQRGLPTRAADAADPMLGTRRGAYGETSGGRTLSTARPAEPAAEPSAAPAPAQTPAVPKGHGH